MPRSLLKSFSPTTLRTTTTSGAKGPPVALLPIMVAAWRLGALPPAFKRERRHTDGHLHARLWSKVSTCSARDPGRRCREAPLLPALQPLGTAVCSCMLVCRQSSQAPPMATLELSARARMLLRAGTVLLLVLAVLLP